MHLDNRTKIQLAICAVVALVAGAIMVFGYMRLPATLFGVGRYTVTVELPSSGGLYRSANVTYRGTEVGRVTDIHLSKGGVVAVLSLRSDISIPSDLDAQVHSVSSLGEQYVALTPRSATSASLKNGDVIPISHASVPPDVNGIIAATNRGLQAIPRTDLKTVVDESYTAFAGLGPDLSRLVKGSTTLAIDARTNLDAITTLIDQSAPVLDSQADTADAIHAWAAHLATITDQLRTNDSAVAGLLQTGPNSAAEIQHVFERVQPTVPILLANFVSIGQVGIAYQPNIEQILVLYPQLVSEYQGAVVAGRNTKQDYRGAQLDFNLNLNLPPPCTTGFLPAQQRRNPTFEDYPDVAAGDLYCRVPQDSNLVAVRGARNAPCATVPGKRAPTVKMCESDETYVPLNDGTNWKGDPNATLSGQDIPQSPPQNSPPASPLPPLAVAPYDPATGSYIGPDGQVHTRTDLAGNAPTEQTWQSMLLPPPQN
ncbi:MCE family protein [Mycobacterium sp. OAE908]|uniref:MCE family protein n=1 Tax=Mycobacterium sp. OAE908 TaxID=2817899 RepID=UPI001AE4EDB1